MGEITREAAIEYLITLNPKITRERIMIYVDAVFSYQEATENIQRNGAISAHPRTGAPFENPYFKIRTQCANILRKIRLETGTLWKNDTLAITPTSTSAGDSPQE